MQQIIDFGKVTRGWLGVEGTEITARAAMATGDPRIKGALIVGVFINSPADMAGIRAGDIVVAVNDNPVLGIRDLLDQITLYRPDEQIRVTIYRGPEKMTLDMKVTQRPQ
jgi:S1-C subfamily serine protease